MAWSENIHVHVHNDCGCIKEQLDRIESKIDQLLNSVDDEALRQQIMDKLNALKIDIEGTI